MNIVNSYIRSHMKHDKKNAIFILVTLIAAMALISTLTLVYYTQHCETVEMIIVYVGDWHFSITQPIPAGDVHYITDRADVAEVRTNPADTDGMVYVNVRLENMRKTYPISEEICAELGLERNVYDRYPTMYNQDLLGIYGIKNPYTMRRTGFESFLQSVIATIALTMALFVVIIYNVITMTENQRIKELGILKSIGMSPKNIHQLIIRESLMYCIAAAPIGLVIGYILQASLISFRFSLVISLICVTLLMLTVVIAAFLPARKMAKLTAIESIKGKEYTYAKKNLKIKEKTLLSRLFGLDGMIANNNFKFYRSMFNSSLISFSLFLTIILAFQLFLTVWLVHSTEQINSSYYDTSVMIYGDERDNTAIADYLAETDSEYTAHHDQSLHTTVKFSDISDRFTADGGFNSDILSELVLTSDGWLMSVSLIGMDDKSFENYCAEIGADASDFSGKDAIVVNNIQGGFNDNVQNYLPWDENIGGSLTIDAMDENLAIKAVSCDVTMKYLTDKYPPLYWIPFPYDIFVIVTEETYYTLMDELKIDMEDDFMRILFKFSENVTEYNKEISNVMLNYDNYYLETRENKIQDLKTNYNRVANLLTGLMLFFGIIGVCSAYTTVTGSFTTRGKDFALLRSQGIEMKRLKKILLIESVIFSVVPFLIAIPITIIGNIPMFMLFTSATVTAVLAALPYGVIIVCVIVCIGSVILSYAINTRRMFRNNIVEKIRT